MEGCFFLKFFFHTLTLNVCKSLLEIVHDWLLVLFFQPHFPFSLTTAKMAPGPQDAKLHMTGEEN